MVYLGGPRRRRGGAGAKGIYLHDPPPGYHPPGVLGTPAVGYWIHWLQRSAGSAKKIAAGAFMVMLLVFIATHS